MTEMCWWQAVTPHKDIEEGRVNEALFAANLGRAVKGEGPMEYCDPETFFRKTYLTNGLRELLGIILSRLSGDTGQNAVVILQTSFGGGKTHSELAIYHLLVHSAEAMSVPQVRALVQDAGLSNPPECRVAVLPGTSLNPLGRTTADGVNIHTLWGEMAYQLGGTEAFSIVAENDSTRLSPGSEHLARVLEAVGPCVILFDETLHYVDRAAAVLVGKGDLATQTVAFLRELTDAVNSVPRSMMVVSLTASQYERLSPRHMEWLSTLNEHVIREATRKTPVERTEIHEIVRQRLFEEVNEDVARRVAGRYRGLYASLGGLPAHKTGEAYQQLMERSYPFHPELVSVLYERWGSRPGFQLTRDTLRFLAFALQGLWRHRSDLSASLIQSLDIDLADSTLRGMAREVAGDPRWEAVIGTDITAQSGAEPAKAQLIDQERSDGLRLAQGLATTILLYSLGGGEHPLAARDELRLACARENVQETVWEDILAQFGRDLFYYYFDDAKHRFRKEPNVLSLHHTYRTNLKGGEVDAYAHRIILERALEPKPPGGHGFKVYFRPEDSQAVPDDDELKLVVLDLGFAVRDGEPTEKTRDMCFRILENRGQVHRQNRNTIAFCVADADDAAIARRMVGEYLSWRKIQQNESDWDRIGGAQQALVTGQLGYTEGASVRALISAHGWAVLPALVRTQDSPSGKLDLKTIRLGAYGPGKLAVPMVWERLTADGSSAQAILTTLTAETFLDRHRDQAWPSSEVWVSTAQLWERFTRLVGLPMLASRQVLLDTLMLGQREGRFAIGHVADASLPRDERDSYLSLFFKEQVLPPQVPMVAERWLLLRPTMYEQITSQPAQVTPAEVAEAINALNGEGQPVRVASIYNYVKKGKDTIDDQSFKSSLARVVSKRTAAYRIALDAPDVYAVPESSEEMMAGFVVIPMTPPSPPSEGRLVTVTGTLGSLNDLGPLFKSVLLPLGSQNPTELTITIRVKARYDRDPGAGLTATLADGFTQEKFPGLTLTDSKQP